MRLFVDTSSLVALANKDDDNHASAVAFREQLRRGKTQFKLLSTSNYIFDETMTLLRAVMGHGSAVSSPSAPRFQSVQYQLGNSRTRQVRAGYLAQYRDKSFSYTD